jgi:hypothetical protein
VRPAKASKLVKAPQAAAQSGLFDGTSPLIDQVRKELHEILRILK